MELPEVVLTAAPFCYGPTSKLLSVASGLRESHSLTFVGKEPGLSLARQAGLRRIFEIEDRDSWSGEALNVLRRSKGLISALDARALKVAADVGVPAIFLDTLLWLRTEPPEHADKATRYIAQGFFRKPEAAVAASIPRLETVGPIFTVEMEAISRNRSRSACGTIIVNFGGLTSPAMLREADQVYLRWLVAALSRTDLPRHRLVVCVPAHLAEETRSVESALPGSRVCSPDLNGFHRLLAAASLCITVPGLETVLEAMYLRVPLLFLPPHNGTQLVQEREYRSRRVGPLAPEPAARAALSLENGDLHGLTRKIQSLNRGSSVCPRAMRALSDYIEEEAETLLAESRISHAAERSESLLASLGPAGRKVIIQRAQTLAAC